MRLLGVHASGFDDGEEQMDLLVDDTHERWRQALSAADRLRDKYRRVGGLAGVGHERRFRERVHENPAGLPGKGKPRLKAMKNLPLDIRVNSRSTFSPTSIPSDVVPVYKPG